MTGELFIATVFTVVTARAQVVGINSVVDLSHWNEHVDFLRAKADGIQGVIHKSTQGLGYVDPKYESRKALALAAGIHWGAYHFANGSNGVDQANFFLRIVGDDPNTLIALDLEENPSGPTVNRTIAEDFVSTVYEATGRYPLIYGSKYFLRDMVSGTKSVLLDCPLWFAQWTDQPSLPENSWSNWSLWQYTDGRVGPTPWTVDGIGACDRDTINADIYPTIEHFWNTVGRHQAEGTSTRPQTNMPRSTRPPTRMPSTTVSRRYSSSDSSEERTSHRSTTYGTRRPSSDSSEERTSHRSTTYGNRRPSSDSSEERTSERSTKYGTRRSSTTPFPTTAIQ